MPSRSTGRPDSISLDDVETMLREVEKAHCCNVRIEMTVPVASGTSVLFWVKVEARPRIVGRITIKAVVAKSHRWPTSEALTLYGLMFRLLYDLDRALDAIGHVPAEQATMEGW